MRRPYTVVLLLSVLSVPARAHDIPNARVDRSTQATLRPGRLEVDYEVSLSELTLTQDLRALIGSLPGADRQEWFDRYGRETGPLNAKGMLVTVDGRPVVLSTEGFDLAVEQHPRYTFHFAADLPPRGRLVLHDTNYAGSEGTSRLAVRGRGVVVRGDDLPADVEQIPIRPAWQLGDAEEHRTKRVEVDYSEEASVRAEPARPSGQRRPELASVERRPAPYRLSRLLDRSVGLPITALALIALGLGAAHAIQPGHGKTLVAAAVVGEGGSWFRGAALALIITLTHTGSVVLVALGLWWTRTSQYAEIHRSLARGAGFMIAAVGFWRLGRHLGGFGEHDKPGSDPAPGDIRGVIGLGVAGGLVPCWDAVGLVLLAEAVGRLGLGLILLLAFGLGMGSVLVAVGWAAARVRRFAARRGEGRTWEQPLGIAGSLVLASIGVYLLLGS
jgi:ABC-type nickel/cobalt efflux system permease component RcnA